MPNLIGDPRGEGWAGRTRSPWVLALAEEHMRSSAAFPASFELPSQAGEQQGHLNTTQLQETTVAHLLSAPEHRAGSEPLLLSGTLGNIKPGV